MRSSKVWLVISIFFIAISFVAAGCAKKQVVKEEVSKPAVEAKKEAPPPSPPPKVEPKPEVEPAPKVEAPPAPKVEAPPAPAPAPAPKVEAAPPKPAPEPIDLVSLRIQFAFDDYSLSTKAKENLEKLAAWLSKNPKEKIQIEGHTCDIGTSEYNLALGERRANSAKKYLEGLGISEARISTISYGEERPLVPNKNEAERSKNRRDEFVKIK